MSLTEVKSFHVLEGEGQNHSCVLKKKKKTFYFESLTQVFPRYCTKTSYSGSLLHLLGLQKSRLS